MDPVNDPVASFVASRRYSNVLIWHDAVVEVLVTAVSQVFLQESPLVPDSDIPVEEIAYDESAPEERMEL